MVFNIVKEKIIYLLIILWTFLTLAPATFFVSFYCFFFFKYNFHILAPAKISV